MKYAQVVSGEIINVILTEETNLGSEFYLVNENDYSNISGFVNFSKYFPQGSGYAPTQEEIDLNKFLNRAGIKDRLIAEMAQENIARVRAGTWTTAQLVGLTQDEQLKELLNDLNSLSFEIAYTKVDGLTNPLLTTEIKNSWKTKLATHFYNG
jgi:hypothetical protein